MAKNRNNDMRINEDITPKNVVDNEFFENASVPAEDNVEPEVQIQEEPKKQQKKQEQPALRKFLKFNK